MRGISSEISFWAKQFDTPHDVWIRRRGYSPYTYENDFKYEQYVKGDKVSFLEVGAGPVGDCGSKPKGNIELTVRAVDPLAFIYQKLKTEHGLETKVAIEFACVEHLSDKFGANQFDVVHMRNSLDHSFNPMLGIMQMLYVVKVGGRLILNHLDNEAEFEKYRGMHQWNLQVSEGKFYIWKKDLKIDVTDALKEYADIECTPSPPNKRSYHIVIIDKRKETPLIEDPNRFLLIERLFTEILSSRYDRIRK